MRKVLFLALFSVILSASTFGANSIERFFGNWAFQKAEYMEASSNDGQTYKTIFTFDHWENLRAYESCSSSIAYEIAFRGDFMSVYTLANRLDGRWSIFTDAKNPNKGRLDVGTQEELGYEFEPGIYCTAQGLRYLIELVDENTLCLTTEFFCDGKQAAVKITMKKD